MLLSKKEGWLALSSSVLLVVSCVVRAMLGDNGEGSVTSKSKALRPRPRMRADAESFVPRNNSHLHKPKPVHRLHVSQYRSLLVPTDDSDDSSPVEQKPPRSRSVTPPPGLPEPSFTPPPGLPEPEPTKTALQKTPPWRKQQDPAACVVVPNRGVEARALLASLVELEKDTGSHTFTHDGRTRKPAGKRIVAGLRESSRAVANDRAVAILVAHDLKRTADGKLEEPKMQKMVEDAQAKGVAVAVSLSRAELGDTVSKDVSSAVLAVVDVSGAEDAFQRFLHASAPAA